MDEPLVSIIIPVYNAENYLSATISSALNQTWANKEVIVIDNGSTDNSLDAAYSFGNQISIYREDKKSASAARNKGLAQAKGEYIQFLDADDLLKNNKIEIQLNALKDEPGVIAYGRYVNFFDSNDIDSLPIDNYLHTDYSNGRDLLFNLYGGNDITKAGGMLPLHSWLAPRSIINAAGNWNENLTVDDDGEFFCRVVLNSAGIKFVKDSICYYRRHTHQKNLSAQKSYQSWLSVLEAIKLKQQHIGNIKAMNVLLANQAMHLLIDVYPKQPALCKQIKQFIKEMGGNNWQPYHHGSHKTVRKVFGWKVVRLLSYYKNQIRY